MGSRRSVVQRVGGRVLIETGFLRNRGTIDDVWEREGGFLLLCFSLPPFSGLEFAARAKAGEKRRSLVAHSHEKFRKAALTTPTTE